MEISINCENILHDKSEAIQYIAANTRHYMHKYQKGWYNNMKRSVKKRVDKKALFTTEAVSACTVFV